MASKGSPENLMHDNAEESGFVLRQYLSGENETDDDVGWRGGQQHNGDDLVHDQGHDGEDLDEDYPEDDGQHVPKEEPIFETVGEEEGRNDAQSVTVMDDVEHEEPDPLDDVTDQDVAGGLPDNVDEVEAEVEAEAEVEFEESEGPEDLAHVKDEPTPPVDPNIWTLPADRDVCTLEEIRRGQVINRVAPNECPVMGCGKKINEMRAEPSPGTIASGLRTHVLFVHYAMTYKRAPKKRKLAWSGKRRSSASPKKPFPSNDQDYDMEPENFAIPTNDLHHPSLSSASLIQRNTYQHNRNSPPGSMLNKKIKQLSANNPLPQQHTNQSSLQSLMQATGMGFGMNNGARYSPQSKQKGQDLSASQKNFNQTTSSLFSILAGLTQQPQQNQQQSQHQQNHHQQPQQQQQQQPTHRANLSLTSTNQTRNNAKPAHGANTLSLSQCSRNGNSNNYTNSSPINSSLLTLLNEKISGNVASSLQSQLKKSIDSNNKIPATSNSRINTHPNNHQYYQNNMSNNDNNHSYNNSHNINNNNNSLLSNLNTGNGDLRHTNGEIVSSSINSFIESIARKTGSNIGPGGVAETKKIIEKFVTWLMCSSQTIADHYIAPYAGEAPQQKPEISASDVILAYKMMQKSQPQ